MAGTSLFAAGANPFAPPPAPPMATAAAADESHAAAPEETGVVAPPPAPRRCTAVISAVRRLAKDYKELQEHPIPGVTAAPLEGDDTLLHWHASITPREGTYEGVPYHLKLVFPRRYPAEPPVVNICTPIPGHPNIFGTGICLDMLRKTVATGYGAGGGGWSVAYTASAILVQLASFLFEEDLIPQDYGGAAHTHDSTTTLHRKKAISDALAFKCKECPHTGEAPWPAAPVVAGSGAGAASRARADAHRDEDDAALDSDDPAKDTSTAPDYFACTMDPKDATADLFLNRPCTMASSTGSDWCGGRATVGVVPGKSGAKVVFHVRVMPTRTTQRSIVRCGWSTKRASLDLGRDRNGVGYGGTGKWANNNNFRSFGKPYGAGQVVTCLLDVTRETGPRVAFAVDGVVVAPPQELPSVMRNKPLFPTVSVKCARVELMFGAPPAGPQFDDMRRVLADRGYLSMTDALLASAVLDGPEDAKGEGGGTRSRARISVVAFDRGVPAPPSVLDGTAAKAAAAAADAAGAGAAGKTTAVDDAWAGMGDSGSGAGAVGVTLGGGGADADADVDTGGDGPEEASGADSTGGGGAASGAAAGAGAGAGAGDSSIVAAVAAELAAKAKLAGCNDVSVLDSRETVCFYSKDRHDETVLGMGVTNVTIDRYSVDGRLKSADVVMDFLSLPAFRDHHVHSGVWQEDIDTLLPLALNDDHAARAYPYICDALNWIICPVAPHLVPVGAGQLVFNRCIDSSGRSKLDHAAPALSAETVLQVIPCLMNSVVLSMMGGSSDGSGGPVPRHASEKALLGYCSLHHLLLYLAKVDPRVRELANDQVARFVASAEHRHKKHTPNLGELLPLVTLADAGWTEMAVPFLREVTTRNALWLLRAHRHLNVTRADGGPEVDEERMRLSFDTCRTSMRIVMFQVFFLTTVGRSGTPEAMLAAYNERLGRPTAHQKLALHRACKDILTCRTYAEFFERCHLGKPSPARITRMLREAIVASAAAGYHDIRHMGGGGGGGTHRSGGGGGGGGGGGRRRRFGRR